MFGKIPSRILVKTWLKACRSQQLSKSTRQPPPIFSFVNYKSGPATVENYYLSTYPKSSIFMAPHIKKHLQTRGTRKEGLPDLHLAWNGGLGPIDQFWDAFPRSVTLSASHMTIGVKSLFDREQARVHELPRRMFGWMVWNSKYTAGARLYLRHLTLIDETVYETREQRPEEDPDVSSAIVEDFPIIPGLEKLDLIFMQHPGQVLLDKLSQKCKAHNVDHEFSVWAQR